MRETFIVQVEPETESAVVEHVRTRRCTTVDLCDLTEALRGCLDDASAEQRSAQGPMPSSR